MAENPWLDFYDSGVPHSLKPYPDKTLCNLLSENAKAQPGKAAVYFEGAQMTWSELEIKSDLFARVLVDMGIEKGDRVALILPNCPQFLICQFGAWKVGAIVSPLNPLYLASELKHALNETGATLAVTLTLSYKALKSIQGDTRLEAVIATSIKDHLPPLKRILFTLFLEQSGGHRIKLQRGDHWLTELLDQMGSSTENEIPGNEVLVDASDPALLMFTGGTEGPPKAAIMSHQALIASGLQIHAWSGDLKEDWKDVNLMLMPMYHAYGNMAVLPAAIVGKHLMVLVPDPRDLDGLLKTINKVKPAYISGVPTLFNHIVQHERVQKGKVNFASTKVCISGAESLMQETKSRFESATGSRIIEAYALTESGLGAVITPVFGKYKPGTIGIPLPDVEVRIVDGVFGDKGLPPGEVGEITMRAPQLMLGYWGKPDVTAETVRDGWLYTGDMGFLDSDGYLTLVDRKKFVIKRGGFQVWPREVEEVIASHPNVAEVGVAGIPDPHEGETIKAWIVLCPGSTLSEQDLRVYCKERLAAYKVPRRMEFRDTLPKSAVGKVLRKELILQEIAG